LVNTESSLMADVSFKGIRWELHVMVDDSYESSTNDSFSNDSFNNE